MRNYLVFSDSDNIVSTHKINDKFWDSIEDKRLMIVKTKVGIIKTYAVNNNEFIVINDERLHLISCIQTQNIEGIEWVASPLHASLHYGYINPQ